ncbi:hypothetical protein ABIC27_005949 [Streptomyces sp. PvR034]
MRLAARPGEIAPVQGWGLLSLIIGFTVCQKVTGIRTPRATAARRHPAPTATSSARTSTSSLPSPAGYARAAAPASTALAQSPSPGRTVSWAASAAAATSRAAFRPTPPHAGMSHPVGLEPSGDRSSNLIDVDFQHRGSSVLSSATGELDPAHRAPDSGSPRLVAVPGTGRGGEPAAEVRGARPYVVGASLEVGRGRCRWRGRGTRRAVRGCAWCQRPRRRGLRGGTPGRTRSSNAAAGPNRPSSAWSPPLASWACPPAESRGSQSPLASPSRRSPRPVRRRSTGMSRPQHCVTYLWKSGRIRSSGSTRSRRRSARAALTVPTRALIRSWVRNGFRRSSPNSAGCMNRARAGAERPCGITGRQQVRHPQRVVGVLGHALLGLGVVQRAVPGVGVRTGVGLAARPHGNHRLRCRQAQVSRPGAARREPRVRRPLWRPWTSSRQPERPRSARR